MGFDVVFYSCRFCWILHEISSGIFQPSGTICSRGRLQHVSYWRYSQASFLFYFLYDGDINELKTSVFESTIRYLGGLLSAYELSNEGHPILLQKARQLADKLAFAWVGVSFLRF